MPTERPAVRPATGGNDKPAPASPPEDAEPQSAPQAAPSNGSEPPSVIEQLRRRRDEVGKDRMLELDIPGYGGALRARYRELPYRELTKARKRMAQRGASDPEDELRFAASALARACDAFLVRETEDAEPVELQVAVPEFGEEPVRYDQRLAKALGLDESLANSAVTVVRMVFNNTYALANHYDDYDRWLASNETDKDF